MSASAGGAPPAYAAFVSPHGFGHAARASAVLAELHALEGARFELFATTPRWFFDEVLEGAYTYHEVVTDVGLRQRSALEHDLEGTVEALDALLPFDEGLVDELAGRVRAAGVRAVLCDIAPLGVAVAERAEVPSLLLENFTWPWLYEPFTARAPGLADHARALGRWLERATVHLQTEPLCARDPAADGVVGPVARRPKRSRAAVRAEVGIPPEAPVVVLTMGGVAQELPFLDRLRALSGVHLLVTGVDRTRREGTLHLFDNGTRIHLPDFLRAADAVVAKLGYSTVAEVWGEGLPLAYVTRADFRETAPMRRWVEARLDGFEIPGEDFAAGAWIERIPELLERGRQEGPPAGDGPRGAPGERAAGRAERPARTVARRLQALGRRGGSAGPRG